MTGRIRCLRADVSAPALVPVEVVEVSDDDRYGQGDGEHARDHTESPNQFAPDADGRDVAVAYGSHRDDRPPERTGDRRELTPRLAGLSVVRRRAEDYHCDQQEEEEHPELVETGLYCHAEDAQTLRQRQQLQQ